MSRKEYPAELEVNRVLKYQENQLSKIKFADLQETDQVISSAEQLLASLGYSTQQLPKVPRVVSAQKKIMVIPKWETLVAQANNEIFEDCQIEDFFSEDELKANKQAIKLFNKDFQSIYKLDKFDITLVALAGILAGAVDILMVGIPEPGPEGTTAGPLSNYIRGQFDKVLPEDKMSKLANSKKSKVPYDAQDNRNTKILVEGLSAYYHRFLSPGHDPFLGFVVGVSDIMNGQMTTIDINGKIVVQVMENYSGRVETNLFAAISKEFLHLISDVTTSKGLPAPLMTLFNLLQFGNIGEEEQTIAEIVQGMYGQGYDFIHFAAMSIPMMLVEVIVRMGYAIKRVKEGHSIKDSIPLSLDRDKNPKLATMLFTAHSAATAINAGKVVFSKNPCAINYPEWIAFANYSFSQLRWVLLEKPELQDRYVSEIIFEEFMDVFKDTDNLLNEFAVDYDIVFE